MRSGRTGRDVALTAPLAGQVALFSEAAIASEPDRAWAVIARLLDQGCPPQRITSHLLAAAQHRVGQLWEAGLISVADEHAATAVTEYCLDRLWLHVADIPAVGRVLVTGVDGEWHTLTSRMVAATWRASGLEVVALTPSLPAADLRAFAMRDRASVAGVSCSIPAHLLGAWLTINALRVAGQQIVVGGRAFDTYPHLGKRLGADEYVGDPFEAVSVVRDRAMSPKLVRQELSMPFWAEVQVVLDGYHRTIVGAAALLRARQLEFERPQRVREDLELLLQAALSGVLCDEPNLVFDHLQWLRRALTARGQDPSISWDLLDSLRRVVPQSAPRVHEVLALSMHAAAG